MTPEAVPDRTNLISAQIDVFQKQRLTYLARIATIDTEMRENVGLIIDIATCQLEAIKEFLSQPKEKRTVGQISQQLDRKIQAVKKENIACFWSLLGARDCYIVNGKQVELTEPVKANQARLFKAKIEEEIQRAKEELSLAEDTNFEAAKQKLEEEIMMQLIIYNRMLDSKTDLNTKILNIEESKTYKKLQADRDLLHANVPPTDIWSACEKGDLPYIQKRIEDHSFWKTAKTKNLFVNQFNHEGNTLLHIAAEREHVQLVHFLLKNGADPAIGNQEGYQPLHYAAQKGDLTIIAELLRCKAPLEGKALNNRTPLHMAAYNGRVAATQLLLTHGANIKAQTALGETALHKTARLGKTDVAAVLVKWPLLDTNLRNSNNETALLYALTFGQTEIANLIAGHVSWKLETDPKDPNHFDNLQKKAPQIPAVQKFFATYTQKTT